MEVIMKTLLLVVLLSLSTVAATTDVFAQGCPNGRKCGNFCCP
jgi:hypothetical protein